MMSSSSDNCVRIFQYRRHSGGSCCRCWGNPDMMYNSGLLSATWRSSVKRRDSPLHVTALISTEDMAAISSISLSASVLSGCGSAVGLRDKASGALFEVPFIQLAVNAYPMILVFRCCSRGFRISSSLWLFSIGTRGWWSVTTMK